MRPLRSHLYAPGNNEKLLAKVFEAGADAVVLDLEDAVPLDEKARAREMVGEAVAARAGRSGPAVFVRINHPDTGLTADEIATIVRPGLDGIRVPKVERARDVELLTRWLLAAEQRAGLEAGSVKLICNIESALGVWHAQEIAAADVRVFGLAFGIADFMRDLNLHPTPGGTETLFARSQLVVASRVAGSRPPIDSVHTNVQDLEGLEANARAARALGFFGKSAIHPRQVAVINDVFTPGEAEVERARAIVAAYERSEAAGTGAVQLDNGDFVDPAIVRRAQDTLALAASIHASTPGE